MKTALLLLAILSASCGALRPVKDVAVHYLLDPAIPARQLTGTTPAIAVARPSLPVYLDRQQWVSRSAEGQLQMHSGQLWAEPLDAGISRVTAVNLGRLTNSLNIQPAEAFVARDYQSLLEIRIARFEPDPGGDFVLECTWKLQPVSGHVIPPRSFSTVIASNPASEITPQAVRMAAMNEALVHLAKEIAGTLR